MEYLKIVLSTFLIVACTDLATATFQNCNTTAATVTDVKCNGAAITSACILKKGETATLEVDFTTNVASPTMKSVCHGIIGGVPVPFNDIEKDGCKGLEPACPVVVGTKYKFTSAIAVKSIYPSIKLIVKWQEQDANGNDIFCIAVPAQIQ